MCEIDNIAWNVGVSEGVRSRVEDRGRVEMTAAEQVSLVRTKMVHVTLLIVFVVASVWRQSFSRAAIGAFVLFLFGAFAEVVMSSAQSAKSETCRRLVKASASWLLGIVVFAAIFSQTG